ncbi:hypothetical protein AGRO_5517 [Agrobacterium sp. ATCC 31749]|nr:hypothetical protein AGRO_5517 [Agrobacterium sp. ATCC 31749]
MAKPLAFAIPLRSNGSEIDRDFRRRRCAQHMDRQRPEFAHVWQGAAGKNKRRIV